ncbi:MAG: hypothetical protein ABIN48_15060 [Ginsengibacter sp.]
MKKILQIGNIIALVITIIINYFYSAGIISGVTVADVSDQYQNYFTPAGYAFSIWGIIYLGLLGFVIYTGKSLLLKEDLNNEVVLKIGWWFVFSCLANSLWIVFWVNNLLWMTVLLMTFLLFCLVKIILNLNMEMDYHPFKDYLLIYWPFAIYAGWVSVAFIANISAYLVKTGWNGFGISPVLWTIIMIVLAGLINLLVIWKRNLREFAMVGVWALIAIAVANFNQEKSIMYAAIIVSFILLVNVGYSGYKSKHRNSKRM